MTNRQLAKKNSINTKIIGYTDFKRVFARLPNDLERFYIIEKSILQKSIYSINLIHLNLFYQCVLKTQKVDSVNVILFLCIAFSL